MSAPNIAAEGVTNPSIDDLLTKTDSKYKLVLYSAKRARQINAYYSQLGEGLLEYVGPLVDTHVQEKPLSIALREINDDLLTCEDIDPAELAAEEEAAAARSRPASSTASDPTVDDQLRRPRGRVPSGARPRVVLGVTGGIAAYKACELLRRFTESGHDVTVVPTAAALEFVGAADLGRAVRQAGRRPRCGPTCTRCRTSGSARAPTWSWSPRPPPTCSPRPPTGWPTTCSPTPCSPRAARSCSRPAMHTEMWEHPATQANVATLRQRGAVVIEPAEGRLTGADTGKGRLPEPAEIFELALDVLARGAADCPDLAGRHVVVSAGGTREYLDPVRFLGNRSSGPPGLRPGPGRGRARRRGHPGQRQRDPARPGRRQGRPGRDDRRSCATRSSARPPPPTRS